MIFSIIVFSFYLDSNQLYLQFVLQDVGRTNPPSRKSYEHSLIESIKFYEGRHFLSNLRIFIIVLFSN
jgi:hypothetical protein